MASSHNVRAAELLAKLAGAVWCAYCGAPIEAEYVSSQDYGYGPACKTCDRELDRSVKRTMWWVKQWVVGARTLDYLGAWGFVSTERDCPSGDALPNVAEVW